MNRWILCALIACQIACGSALADTNRIVQHNGSLQQDTNYVINQAYMTVRILAAVEGETFEFEAGLYNGDPNDPNNYEYPGDINLIEADPNAGSVAITIVGHDGHAYGAYNVGGIGLVNSGVAGSVSAMNILGDFGDFGPLQADTAGTVTIAGAVVDDIEVGAITGSLTVGGLGADLSCGSLADFTIGSAREFQFMPTITIGGAYANTMRGETDLPTVVIQGAFSGTIVAEQGFHSLTVTGTTSGDVIVAGDLNDLTLAGMASGSSVVVEGTLLSATTGNVAGLIETYNLGSPWPVSGLEVDGHLNGVVRVNNDVLGPLVINGSVGAGGRRIEIGNDVAYDIEIEGYVSSEIWVGNDLNARLTIGEALTEYASIVVLGNLGDSPYSYCLFANTLAGVVHVYGDLAGALWVGTVDDTASITVDGSLTGGLYNTRGIAGAIAIGGDMSGAIVLGNISEDPVDLTGTIEILGDLSGHIEVEDNLEDVNEDTTTGHIIVHGAFTEYATIEIGGEFAGDTEFIAFGYPGGVADAWQSGGTVTVSHYGGADDVYTANAPPARIWGVSECKADCNGDGVVSTADTTPFTLAILYPETYALTFPGLGASMVFHGDMDCDGTVYISDINPFVARVSEGCCYAECGECPGDYMGEALTPGALAALLIATVDTELLADLAPLVEEYAAQQDNEEDAAYWEAVYFALIE